MQNRTMLLLQSIIAFCVYALVALASWQWILQVRDKYLSQGAGELEFTTLAGAIAVIAFLIVLLGIAIDRFCKFIRAPKLSSSESPEP